jgi:hypothetical protein
MPVAALSQAGFSKFVVPSSDIAASLRTWQYLEKNLAAGNLISAHAAFNTYQLLNRMGATATGHSSNPQFAADLAALGTALKSGCLGAAQSAFATVHKTLKAALRPFAANAEAASMQRIQ